MAKKLKLRITKCYLVEVVDEKGYVQEFYDRFGDAQIADAYVFGTKEDAQKEGQGLIRLVERSNMG